jgi:di/tricarboxylate transporter
VGLSAADARLRTKLRAALVAVQREGAPVLVDASRLVLQAGDVLLLSAHTEWSKLNKANRNFAILNAVAESSPPKRSRALWAGFLGLVMVLTQIIPGAMDVTPEWIHLWPSSILVGILMVATGCLSGDQARRSIMWDVYLAIAAAFGVSNAMESTGVAREFAQVFIRIGERLQRSCLCGCGAGVGETAIMQPVMTRTFRRLLATCPPSHLPRLLTGERVGTEGSALTAVYVATALLSELLTNNAAGAIMFPIAAIAGDSLGVEPKKMSLAIMLGASAGFINPFSYQTNLMVYAAGNYKTLEFAKVTLLRMKLPNHVTISSLEGFLHGPSAFTLNNCFKTLLAGPPHRLARHFKCTC